MKASAERMHGQNPENEGVHFCCLFQHHHMTCIGDLVELGTGDALVQEFAVALGLEEIKLWETMQVGTLILPKSAVTLSFWKLSSKRTAAGRSRVCS